MGQGQHPVTSAIAIIVWPPQVGAQGGGRVPDAGASLALSLLWYCILLCCLVGNEGGLHQKRAKINLSPYRPFGQGD